jgi:lipid-binding SYLF domain-containing protein
MNRSWARSGVENPSMAMPSGGHRSAEGPPLSFPLARQLSSMVSAILVAFLAAALSGCAHTSTPSVAADAASGTQAAAKRMVELGAEHGESFLSHSQTKAIRNMLGGVRGVFLAPDLTDEAAILGIERGTGFLLRRHGKEWSDPVFAIFSETSLGYQAGVKKSHMLILLMTDTAVDNFIRGKIELGGTGGFAIGTYGLGVSGTGGIKGGLEMIMLSTNEGVFGGGGWAEVTPALAMNLNDEIYGKSANVSQILAVPGGKYAPAIKLRNLLGRMVVEAWE